MKYLRSSIHTVETWVIAAAFTLLGALLILVMLAVSAYAQIYSPYGSPPQGAGIYMGRDGNVHAQVIVGPKGEAYPVAPTFCTPGLGPCPVVTGPPIGPWAPVAPLAPPLAYAEPAPPPPPPPLGWIFYRYAPCADPA